MVRPHVPPAPTASSVRVHDQMVKQVRRDTGCELAVRRELHRRGLRYRVHQRVLPDLRRDADVVFRRAQVAVFVDGCFWHGCTRHKALVQRNGAWWQAKLARTAARDRETNAKLVAAGWTVVRVWEHSPPEAAAARIAGLLRERGNEQLVVI